MEELGFRPVNIVRLMLERAHIVDPTNNWSKGTLRTYKSKFNVLVDFERDLQVRVIPYTPPSHPPNGPAIRHMWAHEWYSLYPSDWWKRIVTGEEAIKFGTVRALRSAASHFWTIDLLHTRADQLTFGFKYRPQIVQACSPTNQVAYTYFTEGMRRRLGDHPQPSTVLTGKHMKWLDTYYRQLFAQAPNRKERAHLSCAGMTHLLSYLGWLRSLETFRLHWCDSKITPPAAGPSLGLPAGFGVVMYTMLLQTKSSQYFTADVVIAYTTASGLSMGWWLETLKANLTPEELDPDAYIMAQPNGSAWTSHYYQHTFLYPAALAVCRALGDPFLRTFDDSPGNTMLERIWSFNTQRRSGRSEVSRKRPWTLCAATNAEVIEHGRWRISRSTLNMPLAYLEWSTEDRACVTACCM
jgi:hypothetical protein